VHVITYIIFATFAFSSTADFRSMLLYYF